MIKKYTDHAANERTYLAWIRTSIAIMAFGFLIEKFELYLAFIGTSLGDVEQFQPSLSAQLVGLSLFLVGILIIIASTVKFYLYKKDIDSEEIISHGSKKITATLSILIIVMAIFLFFYMGEQIFH
jgi:putative membrane protein